MSTVTDWASVEERFETIFIIRVSDPERIAYLLGTFPHAAVGQTDLHVVRLG